MKDETQKWIMEALDRLGEMIENLKGFAKNEDWMKVGFELGGLGRFVMKTSYTVMSELPDQEVKEIIRQTMEIQFGVPVEIKDVFDEEGNVIGGMAKQIDVPIPDDLSEMNGE